jgi:hypothetical protein
MTRTIRLAATMLLGLAFLAPELALAVKVNWDNHRRIHVKVVNQTGQNVMVRGVDADYQCIMHKLGPMDINAGAQDKSDFEWNFGGACLGTNAFANVRIALKASNGATEFCDVIFMTEIPTPTTNGNWVKRYSATSQSKNCSTAVSGKNSNDPRDEVTITVAAGAKPFGVPSGKLPKYSSNQCKFKAGYPPVCEPRIVGNDEPDCMTADCRRCPDGKDYYFTFFNPGAIPDRPTSGPGCPQ